MPQLLLMAGDVESNPGPVGLDTDSDEEGTDVVSHENMNARCSYNRFARPNPSVPRLRKRPGGVTGYSYHRNGYSYTRSDSLPGTREHGTREEFADNINQAQMEIDDLCIQGLNGDPLTANWVTPGDWSINADGTLSADCNVVDLREIHGGKECRELVPTAHFHEWKINRILVREPPMMDIPSSNHEQIVMNIMLGIKLGPKCYRPGLRHCTHISASDLPSLLPAPQIVRYGPVLYPHEKTAGAHEADGNLAEDPRFHFMDSRQQVLLWALRPPDPRPRPAYCHMVTCDCSGDLDGRGRADGIEYSTDSYDKGNACAPCHYTPSASIYVDPLRPSPLNTFRYVSRASRLHCPLAERAQLHLMRALDTAEARYVYAPSDNSLAAQYMESSNYSACTHGYVEQKHIDYHHRNQKDVYTNWARVVTTPVVECVADRNRFAPGSIRWTHLVNSAAHRQGIHSDVVSLLLRKCQNTDEQLELLHCLCSDAPSLERPMPYSYQNWRGVGRMWRSVLPMAYAQLQAIRAKAPDMSTISDDQIIPETRSALLSHIAHLCGVTLDVAECFLTTMGVSHAPDATTGYSELQLLALPKVLGFTPPSATIAAYEHATTRAQGYGACPETAQGLKEYPVRWIRDQTRTGMGSHYADFLVRILCTDRSHRQIALWFDPVHQQVTVPYVVMDATAVYKDADFELAARGHLQQNLGLVVPPGWCTVKQPPAVECYRRGDGFLRRVINVVVTLPDNMPRLSPDRHATCERLHTFQSPGSEGPGRNPVLAFQLALQLRMDSIGGATDVVRLMQRANVPGGLHAEFPVDVRLPLVAAAQESERKDPNKGKIFRAVHSLSHLVYYPLQSFTGRILDATSPWDMHIGPLVYRCPYHRAETHFWVDIQVLAAQVYSVRLADMLPAPASHVVDDAPPHVVRRWDVAGPCPGPRDPSPAAHVHGIQQSQHHWIDYKHIPQARAGYLAGLQPPVVVTPPGVQTDTLGARSVAALAEDLRAQIQAADPFLPDRLVQEGIEPNPGPILWSYTHLDYDSFFTPPISGAPPRPDPYLPQQLLEAGDIESNPGPDDDAASVRGANRQGGKPRDHDSEQDSEQNSPGKINIYTSPYEDINQLFGITALARQLDEAGVPQTPSQSAKRVRFVDEVVYNQAELDSVPAMPHLQYSQFPDKDKLYILQPQVLREGVTVLSMYSGMLTAVAEILWAGGTIKRLAIVEHAHNMRQKGRQVLLKLLERHPGQISRETVDRAYSYFRMIRHDASKLTSEMILHELGPIDLCVLEPPCQGHSGLGNRNGFEHRESGTLVPVAKCLVDLQVRQATVAGFGTRLHEAPCCFGYIMENVVVHGPMTTLQSMAATFMDRVFGPSFVHYNVTTGDLSYRNSRWWTNMTTTSYLRNSEPIFRCPPARKLAEVVRTATNGRLRPQRLARKGGRMTGDFNVAGRDQQVLNKFVASKNTISQRVTNGKPGGGMLIDIATGQPVQCPLSVRVECLRLHPAIKEVLQEGINTDDEDSCIRALGNSCSSASLRVILQTSMDYAQSVIEARNRLTSAMAAAGDSSIKSEPIKVRKLREQIQDLCLKEQTYIRAVQRDKSLNDSPVHLPSRDLVRTTKARNRKGQQARTRMQQACKAACKAREKMSAAHGRTARPPPKDSSLQLLQGLLLLIAVGATWGPVGLHAGHHMGLMTQGAASGLTDISPENLDSFGLLYGASQRRTPKSSASDAKYAEYSAEHYASLGAESVEASYNALNKLNTWYHCQATRSLTDSSGRPGAHPGETTGRPPDVSVAMAAMSNPKAVGKAENITAVPSRLTDTKSNKPHFWQMGETWTRPTALAKVMDDLEQKGAYAWGLHDLRAIDLDIEFDIQTTSPAPVYTKQYHLAKRESEFAAEWAAELERYGIIKEIQSDFASPIVVAPKKTDDGQWRDKDGQPMSFRLCCDYRNLNAVTIKDRTPPPTADEIMAMLSADTCQIVSRCDAQKAFHQVRTTPEAQRKLAFHVGTGPAGSGKLMTWDRTPFGASNGPACWIRVMRAAFCYIDWTQGYLTEATTQAESIRRSTESWASYYADDILIWSPDDEALHTLRVRLVFEALAKAGVQISPTKTVLGCRKTEFCGFIVGSGTIEPIHSRIAAMEQLKPPKNVSELRSAIGAFTYYGRFLPQFSVIKRPLTRLTKQDQPWKWTAVEQQAFDEIKQLLVQAPALRAPDWSREFRLHTDWSVKGLGATLSQTDDDAKEYAVSYASKSTTDTEGAYCSYEGEMLAVVWAVERHRWYLWGRKFTLVTDNRALSWLRTTARLRSKVARWSLILAEYSFDVEFRKGTSNVVPDLMSRQPTNTSGPSTTGAEPDGRGTEITDFTPSCFFAMQPLTPMARVNALLGNQWAFPLWAGFISAFARTSRPPRRDPYTYPNLLAFLRGELQRASVAPSEWQRLLASSKGYAYVNERLWFYPKDGTSKLEVPPVADRVRLITTEHEALGHLGRDRTYSKLRIRYTWPNMHKDVSDTLRTCSACDRIRSSSNVKASEENPLPLGGLFWRWHIDTAGPLPPSTGGHRYVIVMIEAFSKHIELVPVTTLDSTTTATAFRERVLARFGAPVEVTSDNGSEYAGEFHKQLTTHGVDHRSITPGHPEANGAAERTVASCKKGLKRYVLEEGTARWHEYLPTIEFGYRVTRHQSTGYSPFFLMYGRHLSHPDQLRDSDVWTSVNHDDPDHVHQLIVQRSQILASAMPTAFERLLKAQKRDAVRFRKIKRRDVAPRLHRFTPGSFVYTAQTPLNALDVNTNRAILRVHQALPSGVLVLEGADGKTIRVRGELCSPCFLPNLVTDELGLVPADFPCQVCNSPSLADTMLLCDQCYKGYHMSCLRPPLLSIPEDDWYCPNCHSSPALTPSA